jgi:hypothetical protein
MRVTSVAAHASGAVPLERRCVKKPYAVAAHILDVLYL